MKPDYKIYAVDFDQTLAFGKWPLAEEPNLKLISQLINLQADGDKIILWTCRTGEPLKIAIDLCKHYGLEFDAINENLSEVLEMYENVDSRKITAYYYIDDKSLLPDMTRLGE